MCTLVRRHSQNINALLTQIQKSRRVAYFMFVERMNHMEVSMTKDNNNTIHAQMYIVPSSGMSKEERRQHVLDTNPRTRTWCVSW